MARALLPDLIVCDFMMPEMSGDELVHAVRQEPRIDTTPILILTARNDSAARIAILREGASDYLLKPFFQPELRARVENLVKVKQSEEHLRALQMANDRDRIARDLHDLVIQRVFGVGMRLSSLLPAVPDVTADHLREVVAELDGVISDIRTTIFDLQTDHSVPGRLRAGVLRLASDAGERLGFQPRIRFEGPVETAVDHEAGEQLMAVLRESLSNVIRHAHATSVDIEIASAGAELVLLVSDNGVGPASSKGAGNGLRNMETRASSLGGACRGPGPSAPGHPGRVEGAPRPVGGRRRRLTRAAPAAAASAPKPFPPHRNCNLVAPERHPGGVILLCRCRWKRRVSHGVPGVSPGWQAGEIDDAEPQDRRADGRAPDRRDQPGPLRAPVELRADQRREQHRGRLRAPAPTPCASTRAGSATSSPRATSSPAWSTRSPPGTCWRRLTGSASVATAA